MQKLIGLILICLVAFAGNAVAQAPIPQAGRSKEVRDTERQPTAPAETSGEQTTRRTENTSPVRPGIGDPAPQTTRRTEPTKPNTTTTRRSEPTRPGSTAGRRTTTDKPDRPSSPAPESKNRRAEPHKPSPGPSPEVRRQQERSSSGERPQRPDQRNSDGQKKGGFKNFLNKLGNFVKGFGEAWKRVK